MAPAPNPVPSRLLPTILRTAGWLCALVAGYFWDDARPKSFKTDIFFGAHRRKQWDQSSLDSAFWLIVASLLLSVTVLVVEQRLATDERGLSRASLGLAVVSTVAFLVHLAKFG